MSPNQPKKQWVVHFVMLGKLSHVPRTNKTALENEMQCLCSLICVSESSTKQSVSLWLKKTFKAKMLIIHLNSTNQGASSSQLSIWENSSCLKSLILRSLIWGVGTNHWVPPSKTEHTYPEAWEQLARSLRWGQNKSIVITMQWYIYMQTSSHQALRPYKSLYYVQIWQEAKDSPVVIGKSKVSSHHSM